MINLKGGLESMGRNIMQTQIIATISNHFTSKLVKSILS